MAARDARSLRDDAGAAAAAGKYKRALECYLELERMEPNDAQWPKRAAEMLRRLGKLKEAIAAYDRAADRYTQGGFLVQAIAVCKLILQLDPSHLTTQSRLAAINEQQGHANTRIGTLVESNVALHDVPAVAALREGAYTRPPPLSEDFGGHPTQLPPLGQPAPAGTSPQLPTPRGKVPSDPPFRGGPQVRPRAVTPPRGVGGRVPTPTELARLADGTGPDTDDVEMVVTPRTRTGDEIRVRGRGRNKITTPPFKMAHGAALDQVPLATVMPGAHQHRDDGSQPGIQVIPLGDSDGTVEEYEVSLESGTVDVVDHAGAHEMDYNELDESEELDLADLEEAPLPAPRLIGAPARRALGQTPLFAGLPMEQLEALIEHMEVLSLPVGTVVFREGDPGDALFIVSEGEVSLGSEGPPRVEMSRVGPGGFFGEVSLITEGPRTATVTTVAPTELIKIDRMAMSQVIGEHPDVLRVVLRFVRDRLIERLARTSPLFRPFEEDERIELTERFRFLEIDRGATILMPGQRSDGLYIVLAGRVEVQRGDGTRVALGPGDLLGETSLLTGERITNPVVASTKCLALCLPAEEFRELIMTHPHVLEYVGEQAEARRKVRMI
jgi:CRP-like cAMP-binding protein